MKRSGDVGVMTPFGERNKLPHWREQAYASVMRFAPVFALIMFFVSSLSARSLESIERDLEDYWLPAPEGTKVIPVFRLEGGSLEDFAEEMQAYGVTMLLSNSVKKNTAKVELRNLEVREVIRRVLQAGQANWLYDEGRVIVFGSPSELKPEFLEIWKERKALEEEWRIARIEQHAKEEKSEQRDARKKLGEMMVRELEINDQGIAQIIAAISKATVEASDDGRGLNIVPQFNPRDFPVRRSYTFRVTSLRDILDKVCQDYGLEWKQRRDAITIEKQ